MAKSRRGSKRTHSLLLIALLTLGFSIAVEPALGSGATAEASAGIAANDWLGTLNSYRARSGLGAVSHNSSWDRGTRAHSCYMLENGITHDETPGKPGYTTDGDSAGNSSNVALANSANATPQVFVEMWLTAPFHAIGILRPNLTRSSYGECRKDTGRGYTLAGATLDVIRGIDRSRPAATKPIVFPGNGSTTRLYRFLGETPNPKTMCRLSGSVGLPLIAMMPKAFTSASSTLTGPNGKIATCTLHASNTTGVASSILGGDRAAVVMPHVVLADGKYTASVKTNTGSVTWSFTVNSGAQVSTGTNTGGSSDGGEVLPPGPMGALRPIRTNRVIDTRKGRGGSTIRPGSVRRIRIAPSSVEAVAANVTVHSGSGRGYLDITDCSATGTKHEAMAFKRRRAVSNFMDIKTDRGTICVTAQHASVHLQMEVSGYYDRQANTGGGYQPVAPRVIYNSRTSAMKLVPISLNGIVPADAIAVDVHATANNSRRGGVLKVYACDGPDYTSLVFNYREMISNTLMIPLGTDRRLCVLASKDADVMVELAGYYTPKSQITLYPTKPTRVFDTQSGSKNYNARNNSIRLNGTVKVQLAGRFGIPTDAKAVSLNIYVQNRRAASSVYFYPCDQSPPATPTASVKPKLRRMTNGAIVELAKDGSVCVKTTGLMIIKANMQGYWK